MIERILADGVVVLHLGFILFACFGGLLSLRWKPAAWLHLPAVLWAAAIEFRHGICPLTPLEQELRGRGRGGLLRQFHRALPDPDHLSCGAERAPAVHSRYAGHRHQSRGLWMGAVPAQPWFRA
jgi:hypothetical protein